MKRKEQRPELFFRLKYSSYHYPLILQNKDIRQRWTFFGNKTKHLLNHTIYFIQSTLLLSCSAVSINLSILFSQAEKLPMKYSFPMHPLNVAYFLRAIIQTTKNQRSKDADKLWPTEKTETEKGVENTFDYLPSRKKGMGDQYLHQLEVRIFHKPWNIHEVAVVWRLKLVIQMIIA